MTTEQTKFEDIWTDSASNALIHGGDLPDFSYRLPEKNNRAVESFEFSGGLSAEHGNILRELGFDEAGSVIVHRNYEAEEKSFSEQSPLDFLDEVLDNVESLDYTEYSSGPLEEFYSKASSFYLDNSFPHRDGRSSSVFSELPRIPSGESSYIFNFFKSIVKFFWS